MYRNQQRFNATNNETLPLFLPQTQASSFLRPPLGSRLSDSVQQQQTNNVFRSRHKLSRSPVAPWPLLMIHRKNDDTAIVWVDARDRPMTKKEAKAYADMLCHGEAFAKLPSEWSGPPPPLRRRKETVENFFKRMQEEKNVDQNFLNNFGESNDGDDDSDSEPDEFDDVPNEEQYDDVPNEEQHDDVPNGNDDELNEDEHKDGDQEDEEDNNRIDRSPFVSPIRNGFSDYGPFGLSSPTEIRSADRLPRRLPSRPPQLPNSYHRIPSGTFNSSDIVSDETIRSKTMMISGKIQEYYTNIINTRTPDDERRELQKFVNTFSHLLNEQ